MRGNNQILVWDIFIRVFHWSLVVLFLGAYATGDIKGPLHKNIGLAVLAIVIVRIFYGFCGSRYARFSEFLCSPKKAIAYLRELAIGKPTHYVGHNPAAAWMIFLLLTCSMVVCLSGYAAHANKKNNNYSSIGHPYSIVAMAYADDEINKNHKGKHNKRAGHAGKEDDDENEGIWSEIHEISTQMMLALICLHILGVAVSSIMHKENLTKSMITGRKLAR